MAANLSQPGRRSTWTDAETNDRALDFYKNTLDDIDNGYVRPRVPGFVAKQDAGGACLERHLRQETDAAVVVAELEEIFAGVVLPSAQSVTPGRP